MPAFDPVHDALASNGLDEHQNNQNQNQNQVKHETNPSNIQSLLTTDHPLTSEEQPEQQQQQSPNNNTTSSDHTTQPKTEEPATTTETTKTITPSVPLLNSNTSLDNPQSPPSAPVTSVSAPPPAQKDNTTETETNASVETSDSTSTEVSLDSEAKTHSQTQAGNDHDVSGDNTTTTTTPSIPTIIKQKLGSHQKPTQKLPPAKRAKKQGPVKSTVSGPIITSSRSRHLKKDDGQPFWRRDIQYELLSCLFDNDVKAFSDPYPDAKDQVNIDSRKPDSNGKLSFAELYIKSISQSSKCSKVLKDRLLNDMKMSIPTCMICLLVNVGRMNTTINFVPDMKSQLRTYHSIPSLQVNYDTGSTIDKNDKQLQDTPRLKSILKACCEDSSEPNGLHALTLSTKTPKTNVINMIFILCNIEETINKTFFQDLPYTFFDLFMNPKFPPAERAQLFLWVLYNYLETSLDEEGISQNPFGPKPTLSNCEPEDYDVDTPEELDFGMTLLEQRRNFLASDESSTPIKKMDTRGTPAKSKSNSKSPSSPSNDQSNDSEHVKLEDSNNDVKTILPHPTRASKLDNIKSSSTKSTPQKRTLSSRNGGTPASKITNESGSSKPTPLTTTGKVVMYNPPATPVLRQDIDVAKIRRILKNLRKKNYKKRTKKGLLLHEYSLITKENIPDQEKEYINRIRLKNYKGDFAEYTTKFRTLFNLLKNDYAELNKSLITEEKAQVKESYTDETASLALKEFSLDI